MLLDDDVLAKSLRRVRITVNDKVVLEAKFIDFDDVVRNYVFSERAYGCAIPLQDLTSLMLSISVSFLGQAIAEESRRLTIAGQEGRHMRVMNGLTQLRRQLNANARMKAIRSLIEGENIKVSVELQDEAEGELRASFNQVLSGL